MKALNKVIMYSTTVIFFIFTVILINKTTQFFNALTGSASTRLDRTETLVNNGFYIVVIYLVLALLGFVIKVTYKEINQD